MSQSKPLKVLCLHGYRQNATSFKSKCGAFRKHFKNKIEFVFIDAPHLVPIEPIGQQNSDHKHCYGWWFSSQNPDYFHCSQQTNICKGFDESLSVIISMCNSLGPFDGLLGFSQGSAMVSLICTLNALNQFNHQFKFVIVVSGFKSVGSEHQLLYNKLNDSLIHTPSVHIIGENDQIIAKQKSEDLAQLFSCPTIIYHSGGHLVPSSSSIRTEINLFLNQFSSIC